jgi:hypothetical protein
LVAPDDTNYSVNDSEEYAPYIPVHPTYIPVHPNCLDITKKVLAYRERTFPSDEGEFRAGRLAATSMSQFYHILSDHSFRGMVGPQGQITEPHQYFGLPDFYERGEWDGELERNPDLQVC